MNSREIEIIAVSRLKDALIKTGHLIPEINDNDRSPSWDGDVLAYCGESDKKEDLIGKIRVQVKGKFTDSLKGNKRSFKIDRSDLINFKNNGGAILFVVYLNKNDTQFFCNDLMPEKIKYYLKNAKIKSSKKISIPIFPMPQEPEQLTDYVIDAINQVQLQTSYAKEPIITLDEFEKRPDFESVSIKRFGINNISPIEFLLNSFPKYLYGETKGSPIPIPLEYVDMKHTIVSYDVPRKVTVNKKLYYTSIKRMHSVNNDSCRIGNSFTLTMRKSSKTTNINISFSDDIRERAQDLQFIVDAFKAKRFELDGITVPLEKCEPILSKEILKEWEVQRKWFTQVVETLDILHCNKTLKYSELTDTDVRNLSTLVRGILEKKLLGLNFADEKMSVSFMKIGELHILLYASKKEEGWRIEDFYNCDVQLGIHENSGFKIIPQFDICDSDVLQKSDNLDLSKILPDYKRFGYQDYIVDRANEMMLRLIMLYDITRNNCSLETAQSFSSWLEDAPTEFLNQEKKIINKYQIIKRQRDLTDTEIKELLELADTTSQNTIKAAAYALTGDESVRDYYYQKLTNEERKMIEGYPIEIFFGTNNKECRCDF